MPEVVKLEEVKSAIEEQAEEIKSTVANLEKSHKDMDGVIVQIQKELGDGGKELDSTKAAFQDSVAKVAKIEETLDDLVEKMVTLPGQAQQVKSLGQAASESEVAKSYRGGNAVLAEMEGPLFAKAVTSDAASAGVLPEAYRRAGILVEPDQSLVMRDLLTVLTIGTNAVEWVQQKAYTNNAGPKAESAAASQSNITFEKKSSSVETIAHWIPASRQILSDAPSLQSFVDNRLRYGLKYKEEDQILFGDGTNGNLLGLVPQATAFDSAGLSKSGDTKIDQLRRSILQVALAKFPATGIVLNPEDWCDLELMKTDDNAYLFSNPVNATQPRLWGKRVVEALSMTAGEFLTGSFGMAATLWDREEVMVRVAEQHDDFFIKGMVAMLCEERLALTVEHPQALVTGTLAATA